MLSMRAAHLLGRSTLAARLINGDEVIGQVLAGLFVVLNTLGHGYVRRERIQGALRRRPACSACMHL